MTIIHLWVTSIVGGHETHPYCLCGNPNTEDSTMILERVTCPACLDEQKRIEREREGDGGQLQR